MVLEPGDTLLLYTDGVIDCRDENDNTYGQQRFEENLQSMHNLSCFKIVTKIESSLNLFRGSTNPADDISLMALQYKGRKDKNYLS
jgi:sigma-B regulation protein RsbU (phosphoserine phosphatase)